jgi:cytochrome d ubiquinol oxidase subunit I
VGFPHVMFGSYLTGGLFVLAVAGWYLLRRRHLDAFARAARVGLLWSFVSALLLTFTGHAQAQVMTRVQPMKMAAAEALYRSQGPAEFSLFAVGTPDGKHLVFDLTLPHLLSVLATNTWNGRVEGINDLQARYQRQYGPGDYAPLIPVTYWSFRLMVGLGFVALGFSALGLWLVYRRRLEGSGWFHRAAIAAAVLPFAANWLGWIFTEMGRQPWVVFGLLQTRDAVSPEVPAWSVALSFAGLTALYGLLAVLDGWLMLRTMKGGLDQEAGEAEEPEALPAPSF